MTLPKRPVTGSLRKKDDIMRIEIEREDDGRWIADIPDIPGVMAYGTSRQDAVAKAEALTLSRQCRNIVPVKSLMS